MSGKREQRRSYRVPTPESEALCCFEGPPTPLRVLDISLGGVCVDADGMVPVGTPAYLAIFMPGRGTIRVAARVVHVEDRKHTMGMAFDELSAHGEDLIHDWVTDTLAARRFWGAAPML